MGRASGVKHARTSQRRALTGKLQQQSVKPCTRGKEPFLPALQRVGLGLIDRCRWAGELQRPGVRQADSGSLVHTDDRIKTSYTVQPTEAGLRRTLELLSRRFEGVRQWGASYYDVITNISGGVKSKKLKKKMLNLTFQEKPEGKSLLWLLMLNWISNWNFSKYLFIARIPW